MEHSSSELVYLVRPKSVSSTDLKCAAETAASWLWDLAPPNNILYCCVTTIPQLTPYTPLLPELPRSAPESELPALVTIFGTILHLAKAATTAGHCPAASFLLLLSVACRT
ncbi:hypothetical protein NDU88_006072 [Pleurodeles waltl]|uniref:Uncharacterized protein n=1 Tax=Pleurodeles waltl TaxID=8319 RepID=A0AAV7LPF1_PLEWA|nr:hypothetical protein NDU88_006072 [Pleurodeles waltl]